MTVSEGIDLDRAAMQTMTRNFLREAARAQIALVYYAGHGVQIGGHNYLIPVDVRMQPGHSLTEGMVDMDTILAGLDDQVRTNILIFDACRNNPLEQQTASSEPRARAFGRHRTRSAHHTRQRNKRSARAR